MITFASSEDDAFSLQPAISGAIKDGQVRGSPAVLRSILGYTAASRAAQGGTQSFMDATKFVVSNMLRSMSKKLEIEMLYGQVGYGIVDSGSSGTSIIVKDAEWAPGIWAGSEKMPIEVRDSTGATVRGSANVSSVNMDTKTITLDASISGLTDGDIIWHKGAYGNEFVGIHKVLTTSGVLFNIDNSQYNLFKGNQYDAQGGALSFAKINQAVARAVEKGLEGKVLCLVNPKSWSNLLNDQAAMRKYDSSYNRKKLENGSEALTFFSQNGEIEIRPSIYVKQGNAYILHVDDWARVGSTDITFNRPGADGRFFRDLEQSAGYELRCYTDQAAFCSSPGKNVLIHNITVTE